MARKFALTEAQYAEIESKISLKGSEEYAVVSVRYHNHMTFGIHVFSRQPTTTEMVKYEETTSKMKLRGNKAEVEGSSVRSARDLYNTLIVRAYDVRVGRHLYGDKEPITAEEAIRVVPPLLKREVVREFLGGIQGASSIAEDEEQQEVNTDVAEDD